MSLARFRIGAIAVEPDLGLVRGPEKEVHLEPRVMNVLVELASRPGEIVTKEQLASLWHANIVSDDAIFRCIAEIRRAFTSAGEDAQLLRTIPKRGYCLSVDSSQDQQPHTEPRQIEKLLIAVLESCSDHIYLFDREARYLFASSAGAEAIGSSSEEMTGRNWRDLGMPAEIMEPIEAEILSLFDGADSIRKTVTYPTIYGHRSYEYVLDPVRQGGRIHAVVAVVRRLPEN